MKISIKPELHLQVIRNMKEKNKKKNARQAAFYGISTAANSLKFHGSKQSGGRENTLGFCLGCAEMFPSASCQCC